MSFNIRNQNLYSSVSDLKKKIRDLENQLTFFQDKIEDFSEEGIVKTFQNGKYTDDVRAVYKDLLCWGVGTENVEKVQ